MNKCFVKIARSKDEPGKGGFWRLDAAFESTLDDNLLKKKRLGLGLGKKSGQRGAASHGRRPAATNHRTPSNAAQATKKSLHPRRDVDRETRDACRSLIDEMEASSSSSSGDGDGGVTLPSMDQFNNAVASAVDLYSPNCNWTCELNESGDVYFEQLSIGSNNDPITVLTSGFYCSSSSSSSSGGEGGADVFNCDLSPASMPSSSSLFEGDDLFAAGCCSENSNDCSCSDLLTGSSLDLTIYGQVEQSDWSKFDQYQPSDDHCSFGGDIVMQLQQQQQQQQQQETAEGMVVGEEQQQQQETQTQEDVIMTAETISDGSFFANSAWEELTRSQQSVLSILEPGLDFEGLIDLDQF